MNIVPGLMSKQFRLFTQRNICLSRCDFETHYEVLHLSRTCSQKEIKAAFIKLSKLYHPDKNTDDNTHSKFVKLNQAYSVLSRPETRRDYDLSLVPTHFSNPIRRSRNVHYETDFTTKEEAKPFRDFSFWENRDRSKDSENLKKPYYGIKGIKRMSNSWILSFLALFTLFGVSLQVILINKSVTFSRKTIDEESARNAQILYEVRRKAMQEGSQDEMIAHLQSISDAQEAVRMSKKIVSKQE